MAQGGSDAFSRIDTDGSGTITREEFAKAFGSMSQVGGAQPFAFGSMSQAGGAPQSVAPMASQSLSPMAAAGAMQSPLGEVRPIPSCPPAKLCWK
ncbi:unnamed protein product [Effrenium voratum]|nr:unnamed protein product [Effrenium voratum]